MAEEPEEPQDDGIDYSAPYEPPKHRDPSRHILGWLLLFVGITGLACCLFRWYYGPSDLELQQKQKKEQQERMRKVLEERGK